MEDETLVKGGQGRSDAETMQSGMISSLCFLVALGFAVFYGMTFIL